MSEGVAGEALATAFFFLRRNIPLAGDLRLARWQLRHITGVPLRRLLKSPPPLPAAEGQTVLRCRAPLARLVLAARHAAFVERTVLQTDAGPASQARLMHLLRRHRVESLSRPLPERAQRRQGIVVLSPLALMEASGALARSLQPDKQPGPVLDELTRVAPLEAHTLPSRLARVFNAGRAGDYLGHALHVYKAKFFPRLVRALLLALGPAEARRSARVLDPFVGSGTALLEAQLLGLDSVGVDLDPLSCLISQAKLDLADADSAEMLAVAAEVAGRSTASSDEQGALPAEENNRGAEDWPDWLTRRLDAAQLAELHADIARIRTAVAKASQPTRRVLLVCLSDAITRKLKMRFLGLGVGRFALDVHRRSVAELFAQQVRRQAQTVRALQWFANRGLLTTASSAVMRGDARRLPLSEDSFDLVVTSPPYLPAASGRENYARSKAAALISLGLMTRAEVEALDRQSVGSAAATRAASCQDETLPADARKLLAWLNSDDLKRIKLQPTREYFADIATAFVQIRCVLRPGGTAAIVVSKQSQFYEYRTRRRTFVAPTAEILASLAEQAGLRLDEVLDLELHKGLALARPRSLDPYYERVLVLRK